MIKLILLFFSLISLQVHAKTLQEYELDWSIYDDVEIREFFLNLEIERQQRLINNIKSAKLSLFDGNVQGAINLLNITLVKYEETPMAIIIRRYLALAYFTLGDFNKTLSYLDRQEFLTYENYHKICILRIASMLHLKKNKNLKFEMNRCQNENARFTTTQYRWFKYLTDEFFESTTDDGRLKEKFYSKKVFATKKFRKTDETRTWLKYVLLFDLEELAAEYIHFLPDKSFQDDVIRTLMGYVLFAAGKEDNAKNFVEDLTNSNASYLKAILETKKKEYKTALAHSQAAHKRRPYSINNVQLMTALAWANQKWKISRHTLSKVIPPEIYSREQKLLTTALLVQEDNFYRAQREIEELFFLYNKKMPFEALVVESFIYLTIQDARWKKSSDSACLRFDGMNCWLHLQSLIWEDYPKVVNEMGAEKLKVIDTIKKLTTKKTLPKIRESIFIRQRDILELDIAEDPLLEDIR
jgi:hypothetical protein